MECKELFIFENGQPLTTPPPQVSFWAFRLTVRTKKNGFFFADQNWFSIKVFIWGEPQGGLLAWFVFLFCFFVTERGVRWVGSSETEERQNTESPVSLKQLVKGRPQRPHRLEHFHKVRQAVFGHRVPSRAPGVLLDLYNNVQELISNIYNSKVTKNFK